MLDYGCGHGILATEAVNRRKATVLGVDVDPHKIEVARASGARGATFEHMGAADVPDGPFDCVCVVDVLYLLPPASQVALIGRLVGLLSPEGVLVVKEMDVAPRRKVAVNRLQERIVVGKLGLTQGQCLAFTQPDVIEAAMDQSGLKVEATRVDRWYPYPHHLVVGHKTRQHGS